MKPVLYALLRGALGLFAGAVFLPCLLAAVFALTALLLGEAAGGFYMAMTVILFSAALGGAVGFAIGIVGVDKTLTRIERMLGMPEDRMLFSRQIFVSNDGDTELVAPAPVAERPFFPHHLLLIALPLCLTAALHYTTAMPLLLPVVRMGTAAALACWMVSRRPEARKNWRSLFLGFLGALIYLGIAE